MIEMIRFISACLSFLTVVKEEVLWRFLGLPYSLNLLNFYDL